ncbi:glycoside hydrolase family 93 protein [Melanomma pulvis-pyrius CBS 109.77]|uniref:Glycoside hydrolase family 93 protein n=1 Tax=Melanomma pulvis-pyrius CBS 109.77 TaxID=1314802 RepID=A0A6A6X4F9_9PLEO|nr:glycoside hydrolase family 93 protein [Melanomma pulvis-pyrius CBS 109.77]
MHFLRYLGSTALLFSFAHGQAPKPVGEAVLLGAGGTYPRATKLADGSLLGVYTHFDGGNSIITTVKSTDNGASWTPIGVVDSAPSATRDLDNGYVHQLPNGNIVCGFRNHDKDSNGKFTYFRITICGSEDGGVTWKFLSQAAEDPAGPNGNWEPFFETALDGSLQVYYSRENAGNDQDSLLRRSTDGGVTWTSAQTISGEDVTARDGMLGVARIAADSPTKLAIFESGAPGFTVHTVRSEDDGVTWGSRSLVYEAPGKDVGAPQIVRVGSKLVASFGTNEDGGDWPAGALKVMVSVDGGRTWGDKTTVHGLPAMWSGLLALDDQSFLALYESGGTSYAQKMAF